MVADIALASLPAEAAERERFVTDIVARFSALNITWAGISDFDRVPQGRQMLKEAGAMIQKLDAYAHPRMDAGRVDSGSCSKRWVGEPARLRNSNADVGGVEHQIYACRA